MTPAEGHGSFGVMETLDVVIESVVPGTVVVRVLGLADDKHMLRASETMRVTASDACATAGGQVTIAVRDGELLDFC